MKQVFIVDEEAVFSLAVEGIVNFRGHKPIVFKDASSSMDEIVAAIREKREAVFLIDVTLAGGRDRDRFGAQVTGNFSFTGLTLVREIIGQTNPGKEERQKIILYTANHTSANWERITAFAEKNGCRYWKKDVNANIDEIIDMIEE